MCGIFSFISNKNENFNPYKFKILGIKNDERGGDAVGLYYNGNTHKSITPPLFENYIANNKIDSLNSPLIIGHTRKGSPGMGKTVEQAQPIIIKDDNDNDSLILVHNGTLYNHNDLAKKYNVIDTNLTDTQILAEIIYKNGFEDVLKEYQGAASLIWYDKRDECLYVFKGASKSYGTSLTLTEERPLYWLMENDYVYFSSIKIPLEIIATDNNNVIDIECNKVFKFNKEGILIDTIIVDRANSCLYKHVAYNHNNYNYNHNVGFNNKPDKLKDLNESFPTDPIMLANKIFFRNGNYYNNGDLAHGEYLIDDYGFLKSFTESETAFKITFYNGILIFNNTLSLLEKEVKDMFKCNTIESIRSVDGYQLSKILSKYTPFPFALPPIALTSGGSFAGDVRCVFTNESTNQFLSGELAPLFSNNVYTLKFGDYVSTTIMPRYNFLTLDIYNKLNTIPDYITVTPKSSAPESSAVLLPRLPFDIPVSNNDDICKECNGEGFTENGHYCNACYGQGFVINKPAPVTNLLDSNIEFTDIKIENRLEFLDIVNKLQSLAIELDDVTLELEDYRHITDKIDNLEEIDVTIEKLVKLIDNLEDE